MRRPALWESERGITVYGSAALALPQKVCNKRAIKWGGELIRYARIYEAYILEHVKDMLNKSRITDRAINRERGRESE